MEVSENDMRKFEANIYVQFYLKGSFLSNTIYF